MNETEINHIYDEFRVPKHIINHMRAVADVCLFISSKFEEKGIQLKEKELLSAALLHDTLRICDMRDYSPKKFPQKIEADDLQIWNEIRKKYQKKGHELAMADILRDRGEKYIANLVEKHHFLKIDVLQSWEEKVMYYADKRVNHDQVVSLQERFDEGRKRNIVAAEKKKESLEIELRVFALESELADVLGECIYSL
jgi:uncharacterized protein